MKVTQVLALFAVLAVTVNACGDKNKHPHDPVPEVPAPQDPVPQDPIPQDPHGSVTDSKTQHQEANNNGAEIADNKDNLVGLNGVAKDAVNVLSSDKQNIQISQTQN